MYKQYNWKERDKRWHLPMGSPNSAERTFFPPRRGRWLVATSEAVLRATHGISRKSKPPRQEAGESCPPVRTYCQTLSISVTPLGGLNEPG